MIEKRITQFDIIREPFYRHIPQPVPSSLASTRHDHKFLRWHDFKFRSRLLDDLFHPPNIIVFTDVHRQETRPHRIDARQFHKILHDLHLSGRGPAAHG